MPKSESSLEVVKAQYILVCKKAFTKNITEIRGSIIIALARFPVESMCLVAAPCLYNRECWRDRKQEILKRGMMVLPRIIRKYIVKALL